MLGWIEILVIILLNKLKYYVLLISLWKYYKVYYDYNKKRYTVMIWKSCDLIRGIERYKNH